MTQEEWEQHPIFAAFTAKVLDQLLGEGRVCEDSVMIGRPLTPAERSE